jgi:hypothetical protein
VGRACAVVELEECVDFPPVAGRGEARFADAAAAAVRVGVGVEPDVFGRFAVAAFDGLE